MANFEVRDLDAVFVPLSGDEFHIVTGAGNGVSRRISRDNFITKESFTMSEGKRIMFRDSSIGIYSGTSGQLDIFAGTEIQLTTKKLDLNLTGAFELEAASASISVSGGISIEGDVTFDGGIVLSGNTQRNGNLVQNGAAFFVGDVSVDGDVSHEGNCSVNGVFSLSGSFEHVGNMSLQGDTVINGAVSLSGDVSHTGDVQHNGNCVVNGGFTLESSSAMEALAQALAPYLYPVGSLYWNATDGTNPSELLGFGTWEAYGAGRVFVSQDAGDSDFDTLGGTGGEKSHELTVDESPAHVHELKGCIDGDEDTNFRGIYEGGFARGIYGKNSQGIFDDRGYIKSAGGGESHNNLQPYIVVKVWRRTA